MQHVVGIKPVVTQIIGQQLVGREILHLGQQVAQNMRRHPQHRLAHRIQRQRVLEVPHRAHRQNKAQLRVDAPQVSVRLGQTVDDVIGGEQLPHKQVGRLLVAIVHQLAGFAQAVGPGRSQSQRHHIGAAQKLARALHQRLNKLQQLHRRVGPDAAVQVVALPAPPGLHQVLLPVHFLTSRGAQQPAQCQRLKHRAEGVHQRINLVGREARAHAVGEAGAHGEHPGRAR